MRRRGKIVVLLVLFRLMCASAGEAQVLDSWKDSRAYKPVPVLFLHGFAKGNPADWETVINTLQPYFGPYQQVGPYLETLDFQDPNGSIDTYPPGKLNPQGNNRGWADKLAIKIEELLSSSKYGLYCAGVNIVAHSMGGLAARYYLAVNSSANVPKLILVGVPNLGTPLSSAANGLSLVQELGWGLFLGPSVYLVPLNYTALESAFSNLLEIDFRGCAIDDMDNTSLGSGFLSHVNSFPQATETNYSVIVGKHGSLLNLILFQDWDSGDSVVHTKSQLGSNYITTQNVGYIKSVHWQEPRNIALQKENPVLKFLDSDVPVIEISEPAQSEVETSEGAIDLKGKLFKEYLPADTKLLVTVSNSEKKGSFPEQGFPMLPTDLWQAGDQNSPVAEFSARVILPGEGEFKVAVRAVNPGGAGSEELIFTVKTSSSGPVIEVIQPQGMIASSRPLLYGRARAQGAAGLELSSLSISLDGSAQTVTKNFIDETSSSAEAYCTPSSGIASGEHSVVFTACDTDGRCASRQWSFTMLDLIDPSGPQGLEPPAGGYVWRASAVSDSRDDNLAYCYEPLYEYVDVNPDTFARKLNKVKDAGLSAAPMEYHDGNIMGVYIFWQGQSFSSLFGDPGVAFSGCTFFQQTAHTLSLGSEFIPVYTCATFSCSHQNCCSSYVKNVILEVDDKFRMSLDKKLQTAMFRKMDPSLPTHDISVVIPYYGPRVILKYSMDPFQYSLADNSIPELWPREFRVYDRTHFNLSVRIYGWQKK